jgi:hypothetical protein
LQLHQASIATARLTRHHRTAHLTTITTNSSINTMFRYLPTRALHRAPARSINVSSAAIRPLSTSRQLFAQKDAQDKDSLKPRSTEYSKTGSDDDAASMDAAFDPSKTSPESEMGSSENESGGASNDPLEVSPGNQDSSKSRDAEEGGSDHSPRTKSSGGGSAPKNGGGKSG